MQLLMTVRKKFEGFSAPNEAEQMLKSDFAEFCSNATLVSLSLCLCFIVVQFLISISLIES